MLHPDDWMLLVDAKAAFWLVLIHPCLKFTTICVVRQMLLTSNLPILKMRSVTIQ